MASPRGEDMDEVEATEEQEIEATEEGEEVTVPANAFPCPTCGMLFSEADICEKHAQFCSTAEESGTEWSDERVLLLIDCMHSRYKKYIHFSPKQRKQHWKWAGQIVGATADDARTRWNLLNASYNRVKMAITQGRLRRSPWRFFDDMDKVLGSGSVHRPEFVLSTMPMETSEDGSVQPHTGMLLSDESEVETVSTSKIVDFMEGKYKEFIKMSAKDRKKFWRDVAEELKIPAEEARIRWNMMVGSFRRTKINRMQHKKRYGKEPRNRWRFYEQMERIVGSQPNSAVQLMVISSRENPPLSGFPLATGASFLTASKPLPDTAPASGQPIFKIIPGGVQGAAQDKAPPPATVLQAGTPQQAQPATLQATVLQAGTPQQQQAENESFASKRKALFVEDYLRAKARREEQRLKLEERRIRALERLVDVMEARGSSS